MNVDRLKYKVWHIAEKKMYYPLCIRFELSRNEEGKIVTSKNFKTVPVKGHEYGATRAGILTSHDDSEDKSTHTVVWEDASWRKKYTLWWDASLTNPTMANTQISRDRYEIVIGNIHENPELLKE